MNRIDKVAIKSIVLALNHPECTRLVSLVILLVAFINR